jgi:hypothetical protein
MHADGLHRPATLEAWACAEGFSLAQNLNINKVKLATRDENGAERMELSSARFVFIFCGSGNRYRNSENKYENRY